MSPEQAESLTRPVDHRTDVYSLGASLYELATGKPVFEAYTAHGVIVKILNEEPVPPRNPAELPRDLETIILTCLAKDPGGDIRRPMPSPMTSAPCSTPGRSAADRVRLPERLFRYVRKRRREIAMTARAVVVSTALLIASFLAWNWHDQANRGSLTLNTDGSALAVEILSADRDQPVVNEFNAPNRTPVALPEGPYRVRLSAPGQRARRINYSSTAGGRRPSPSASTTVGCGAPSDRPRPWSPKPSTFPATTT